MPVNGDGEEPRDDDASGKPIGSGNALGLGERLRSARKARALSLEYVAEALHLDERIVLALEEERFDSLGAAVYVRGHLKAYAQLLELPSDTVLAGYRGSHPETITAPALRRRRGRSITINPVMWGVAALMILVGFLLALYVIQDDSVTTVVRTDPEAAPAAVGGPVALSAIDPAPREAQPSLPRPEPAARAPADPDTSDPAALVIAPDVPPVEPSRPTLTAETAPRPQATMRLGLRFSEESWVEISDANRRLLFGLQREGNRRELTGEPPFDLLIGNTGGVELTVDDKPFAVPDSEVRGKVARFRISRDDVDSD